MRENKHGDIHQYLTFTLANEMYAINVAGIKEVLGVPKITRVPRMPDFMNGIINLRGSVVPVLDLAKKFGFGETTMTVDTNIIVTEILAGEGADDPESKKLTIGIFSDEVHKVIEIEPGSIEPPPEIGISIDTSFIEGMGHVNDQFIILLDIDKILSTADIEGIRAETA